MRTPYGHSPHPQNPNPHHPADPARPVVSPRHILLLALFSVLLYGEWYDGWRTARSWPPLPPEHDSGSVRLLLVADPQLQGERNEPAGLLGWLTRWDSDR